MKIQSPLKSNIMKMEFQNRIEAVDWIANFSKNEGQFEVWREQLTFNHIYSETFYLELNEKEELNEVIILEKQEQ